MTTDKKIQAFILRIVEDRVSFGGWVRFDHLKTMGSLTGIGDDIHDKFLSYCQNHGCTLSVFEGKSVAPWSDFRAFLLGEFPDD